MLRPRGVWQKPPDLRKRDVGATWTFESWVAVPLLSERAQRPHQGQVRPAGSSGC